MYTREEVMRWVLDFVWERIAEVKREEGSCPIPLEELNNIVDEFNVQGMLTKDSAKLLQQCLEHYHTAWVEFYLTHYKGLGLMTRTHDSLSYYYEAWYYFCRPGTYNLD